MTEPRALSWSTRFKDRSEAPASAVPQFPEGAKSCSVISYCELELFRRPWACSDPSGAPIFSDPGSDERSLFRALEWMAIEGTVARGLPFANPLHIHPRDVCERLCWRSTQREFDEVAKGLEVLCRTHIPGLSGPGSTGVLRSALPVVSTRTRRSAACCPSYLVYFDSRFVASINAGAIVPLNWSLWVALGKPLARRLLEVLESQWPRHQEGGPAVFSLDFLSARLPLATGSSLSMRRKALGEAHRELLEHEYVSKVDLLSQNRFRYQPGPTHRQMRRELGRHSERVLQARIRSGWSLEAGSGAWTGRGSHNVRRVSLSF